MKPTGFLVIHFFFQYFRLAASQPLAAIYFLRQKSIKGLNKLIAIFSEGAEMYKIISSPKVEIEKSLELLITIHSYFSGFQNNKLPLKQSSFQHNYALTPLDNCKLAVLEIKHILAFIKDCMHFPQMDKVNSLLELAKLVQDLQQCVLAYVELL